MKNRLPRHIGFIPDGNRRWAQARGLSKEEGYAFGVEPGLALFEACQDRGVAEMSIYGFTQDNNKRSNLQKQAFKDACVRFAFSVVERGAALLVLGDTESRQFPEALLPFRTRQGEGIKVNFLVNYGWEWDLNGMKNGGLKSREVSRLDMIVRWGGGRRLSGFLPVQSVYADFFVLDEYWPDFQLRQFDAALDWFARQDQTLGG